MKKQKPAKSTGKSFNSGAWIILGCLVIAVLIYKFIFGNPANFMNNDPNNHPLPGNLLATIYKGGFVVPIIQTLLLTVLALSVERWLTIRKAAGKRNLTAFVTDVKNCLDKNDIAGANALCAKQGGSVGNVVLSALAKYSEVEKVENMSKEQKMVAIQKTLEEATALELPTMEQNLSIIATITTLGTLMGLFGTVLGMIRSFAALANAGSPDSIALSTGISEALINTAFGIATGALAVIFYSFFTSKIDKITYAIDEAGFTIVQSYAANHN